MSWEDAGRQAVKTASKSLRDLRIAEVVKMDMKVEDGKVVAFRTRVALSFKYEGVSLRIISCIAARPWPQRAPATVTCLSQRSEPNEGSRRTRREDRRAC